MMNRRLRCTTRAPRPVRRQTYGAVAVAWIVGVAAHGGTGIERESPMLRARVAAGTLPPLAQRLPQDPMVVRPYAMPGRYGGTLRVLTGRAHALDECRLLLYTPLLRYAADGRTIVPNLARAWEISADARVCTITLRQGVKWSDGAPLTVDDVVFGWEDVCMNQAIYPIPPPAFTVNGRPMKIERVDEFTFRMVFDAPNGALPDFLTRTIGRSRLIHPKHYLKRYHPRYTPQEEVDRLARDRGFDRWYELFRQVNFSRQSPNPKTPPDYPTLAPWLVAETPSIGHTILRRNPYHWQVDPEGRQLPYIDAIHSEVVANSEARNLKFAAGEVDFNGTSAQFSDAPLYLGHQETGRYRVLFWRENHGTRVAYYFNQTHEDPTKRAIFQDRRFRIAMSHAIDRDEINDLVWYGQCLPRQDTVMRVCSFFEPHFEIAHMAHDPARAEQLLDELGLKRHPVTGWRSCPDGSPLVITMDAYPLNPYQQTAELVREYWRAVGILLNVRMVHSSLAHARVAGNQHDVVGYPNDGSTDLMVMYDPFLGIDAWAPLWAKWLRSTPDRREGEPPPAEIESLYRLWQQLRLIADRERRAAMGKRLLASQADHLWAIGTVGETLRPVIVSNRLHNVPEWMVDGEGQPIVGTRALGGWPWLATFLHHPEQWWLSE